MNYARLVVFPSIFVFAMALSLFTTYIYGGTYSHPRYWNGTIERVAVTQVELASVLLDLIINARAMPADSESLRKMFAPLDGRIIVEVTGLGDDNWSNANPKFRRGAEIAKKAFTDGRVVTFTRYEPPSWNYVYFRWLGHPTRWFEPSFDHVTMPFLWFYAIYIMAILSLIFMMKAAYLEKDVLRVFRGIEKRYPL